MLFLRSPEVSGRLQGFGHSVLVRFVVQLLGQVGISVLTPRHVVGGYPFCTLKQYRLDRSAWASLVANPLRQNHEVQVQPRE